MPEAVGHRLKKEMNRLKDDARATFRALMNAHTGPLSVSLPVSAPFSLPHGRGDRRGRGGGGRERCKTDRTRHSASESGVPPTIFDQTSLRLLDLKQSLTKVPSSKTLRKVIAIAFHPGVPTTPHQSRAGGVGMGALREPVSLQRNPCVLCISEK
jgi:hypothetical protein